MDTALPILQKLQASAERQEWREERSRKGWQWFRWIVATMIAAGLLYVAVMELRRASVIGKLQQHPITGEIQSTRNHNDQYAGIHRGRLTRLARSGTIPI